MMKRLQSHFYAVGLALALSGCGLYGQLFSGPPKLDVGDVRIVAEPDANRNSPVVLDVVLVADSALEQRLMGPENKWFPNGPALVASYPGALQVHRCEFPPASEMALPAEFFDGQNAWAVFVFAGLADGERRARIEGWKQGGLITISSQGWRVAPQEKGQAPPKSPSAMHCSNAA